MRVTVPRKRNNSTATITRRKRGRARGTASHPTVSPPTSDTLLKDPRQIHRSRAPLTRKERKLYPVALASIDRPTINEFITTRFPIVSRNPIDLDRSPKDRGEKRKEVEEEEEEYVGGEVDENRVECNPLYIRSIDRAIVRFGGREYRGGEERQGEGTDKGIEYLEFALIYFRQLERGELQEGGRERERKRERERRNRDTRRGRYPFGVAAMFYRAYTIFADR